MTDPYPPCLTVKLDRPRLKRYLRLMWLGLILYLVCFFGFSASLSSAARTMKNERQILQKVVRYNREFGRQTELAVYKSGLRTFMIGAAISVGTACGLYLLLSHRTAAKIASKMEITIEGPYLRIQNHFGFNHDQKIHLRSVVAYEVQQTFFQRLCRIHTLRILFSGGQRAHFRELYGIKDCLRTRDLLAEIDMLRARQK